MLTQQHIGLPNKNKSEPVVAGDGCGGGGIEDDSDSGSSGGGPTRHRSHIICPRCSKISGDNIYCRKDPGSSVEEEEDHCEDRCAFCSTNELDFVKEPSSDPDCHKSYCGECNAIVCEECCVVSSGDIFCPDCTRICVVPQPSPPPQQQTNTDTAPGAPYVDRVAGRERDAREDKCCKCGASQQDINFCPTCAEDDPSGNGNVCDNCAGAWLKFHSGCAFYCRDHMRPGDDLRASLKRASRHASSKQPAKKRRVTLAEQSMGRTTSTPASPYAQSQPVAERSIQEQLIEALRQQIELQQQQIKTQLLCYDDLAMRSQQHIDTLNGILKSKSVEVKDGKTHDVGVGTPNPKRRRALVVSDSDEESVVEVDGRRYLPSIRRLIEPVAAPVVVAPAVVPPVVVELSIGDMLSDSQKRAIWIVEAAKKAAPQLKEAEDDGGLDAALVSDLMHTVMTEALPEGIEKDDDDVLTYLANNVGEQVESDGECPTVRKLQEYITNAINDREKGDGGAETTDDDSPSPPRADRADEGAQLADSGSASGSERETHSQRYFALRGAAKEAYKAGDYKVAIAKWELCVTEYKCAVSAANCSHTYKNWGLGFRTGVGNDSAEWLSKAVMWGQKARELNPVYAKGILRCAAAQLESPEHAALSPGKRLEWAQELDRAIDAATDGCGELEWVRAVCGGCGDRDRMACVTKVKDIVRAEMSAARDQMARGGGGGGDARRSAKTAGSRAVSAATMQKIIALTTSRANEHEAQHAKTILRGLLIANGEGKSDAASGLFDWPPEFFADPFDTMTKAHIVPTTERERELAVMWTHRHKSTLPPSVSTLTDTFEKMLGVRTYFTTGAGPENVLRLSVIAPEAIAQDFADRLHSVLVLAWEEACKNYMRQNARRTFVAGFADGLAEAALPLLLQPAIAEPRARLRSRIDDWVKKNMRIRSVAPSKEIVHKDQASYLIGKKRGVAAAQPPPAAKRLAM